MDKVSFNNLLSRFEKIFCKNYQTYLFYDTNEVKNNGIWN